MCMEINNPLAMDKPLGSCGRSWDLVASRGWGVGRIRVRKPLRMERQPRWLSLEIWSCLTVFFWSELGQEPRTTMTGSASGKKSLMSQPERWPSPACSHL